MAQTVNYEEMRLVVLPSGVMTSNGGYMRATKYMAILHSNGIDVGEMVIVATSAAILGKINSLDVAQSAYEDLKAGSEFMKKRMVCFCSTGCKEAHIHEIFAGVDDITKLRLVRSMIQYGAQLDLYDVFKQLIID